MGFTALFIEVRIARPTDDWQVELRKAGRAPACAFGFFMRAFVKLHG